MNKLNKKLVVLGLLSAIGLSGCASVGGMSNKQVESGKSGVIYGVYLGDADGDTNIRKVCDAIKNKDMRCKNPSSYKLVPVASRFGYASAGWGAIAIADKSMLIGKSCSTGSSSCTYLKVVVEPNKLATVVEVASTPGDGKCKWSGMPRAGGVVCSAYNWNYENNNQAAVNF